MRRRDKGLAPTAGSDDVRFLFRRVLGREPRPSELAERAQGSVIDLVTALRTSAEADDALMTAEDIRALFRALLGRDPDAKDVQAHLDAGTSAVGVQRELLASDERRRRMAHEAARASAPPRVNTWVADRARWTHPPGSRSEDDVAVVGYDGFLFIRGGSNAMLDQYLGRFPVGDGWLDAWRVLAARRQADATASGVGLAMLVVPDKLAAYPDRFPEPLEASGPRPIELLLAADLPLAYPLDALVASRAAGDAVYMRTDSHMTLTGNVVVHDTACRALGIDPTPDPLSHVLEHGYLAAGDLGRRFAPQIVEVMSSAGEHRAEIVEDNRSLVAAAGGHIGTRRVWRNRAAPRPETVVIFGDSYGFGAPGYPGLSFLMAQSFAEVHFVWVPFGWDGAYVEEVGADLVVTQTAERFVPRVPRAAVDVRALEAEAVSRSTGIDPAAAFAG